MQKDGVRDDIIIEYLNGSKLYGDDFDLAQINRWYEEEKEGYLAGYFQEFSEKIYGLDALNAATMYKYVRERKFDKVLGYGSSYGQEVGPIASMIRKLIIVEPTTAYCRDEIFGVPLEFRPANIDGVVPCENACFDLIVSFSVLHHVPNVSFVLNEFYRVLKPGGILLVREPIVSMGDWRRQRGRLTKNERGIPLMVFRTILNIAMFRTIAETLCCFSPMTTVLNKLIKTPYNSSLIVCCDLILCRLFGFNYAYHAETLLRKFRPTSVAYVLEKRF